jgi:hypothetical protein
MEDDMTNVLTVVMHHGKVTREQAVLRVCESHKKHLDRLRYLLDNLSDILPSFNAEVDDALRSYIHGILVPWVRANVEWSFEGRRYFDDKGGEAWSTRTVPLQRGEAAKYRVPLEFRQHAVSSTKNVYSLARLYAFKVLLYNNLAQVLLLFSLLLVLLFTSSSL